MRRSNCNGQAPVSWARRPGLSAISQCQDFRGCEPASTRCFEIAATRRAYRPRVATWLAGVGMGPGYCARGFLLRIAIVNFGGQVQTVVDFATAGHLSHHVGDYGRALAAYEKVR